MAVQAPSEPAAGLDMLASVLAGRPLSVTPSESGVPAWSDGQLIHVDGALPPAQRLAEVAVQASLIGAGSLDPDIVRKLVRHPKLARRYLALEGHRALAANAYLLPDSLRTLIDDVTASRTDSAADSLRLAGGKTVLSDPPEVFGVVRTKELLAAARRAANTVEHGTPGHVPRRPAKAELEELDDGEVDDTDDPDLFVSPVGGGGTIGKWLKKLLSSARKTGGNGGGPPGADSPTHRTNTANRGAAAVSSTASTSSEQVIDFKPGGYTYPEWDLARKSYRPDWCTVHEVEATVKADAAQQISDSIGVRRPLARLGMGLDRRHRQAQGDDIDVDAAVEARVEAMAGSVPDEAVYIDSLRYRRDLSVLLLLDVSGSAAEPGSLGRTVHEQQREVAEALTVALHDLGDRVALYGYYSQGRDSVNLVPVKRFDDHLDTMVVRRLHSLEPGAYSRLGAAVRHGSATLEAHGGTSRRLLVVLSDGLAYDHGYEREYGAADARRALTEARRRGVGCVCLTVGATTQAHELVKVFGSTAHAAIGRPDQLTSVVGPLFRSAIRSGEARRRVS